MTLRRAGNAAAILLIVGATGCVRPRREPEVRWIGITDAEALVEAQMKLEERRRTEKATDAELRTKDTFYREVLKLDAEGYVYHPRFLQFAGALGLALDQGQTTIETASGSMTDDRTESRDGQAPEYEIDGVLLAEHPVSLGFGFNRLRSSVRPAFADLSVVDQSGERAELNFKHSLYPARLYVSHMKSAQEQIGLGENRDEESAVVGFEVNYTGTRVDAGLTYQFEDHAERIVNVENESTRFDRDRQTHDLALDHTLRFGPSDADRLTSRVQVRDEAGTFASRRFSISEALELVHTKQLSTFYTLLFSDDEIGTAHTERVAGTAKVRHKLYESLVSDLEIHGQDERFDGSRRDIFGVGVTFDYRKKIPRGTLYVTLDSGYEITDEQGGETTRAVLAERHILTGAATVFLDHRNVLIDTIVVSNPDRTRTFLRGTDYVVIDRGGRVELRRTTTGAIPDNSAVLVDYSFTTDGSLRFATRTLGGRVQVDLFDFLSLYASHLSSRNDLQSGFDAERLEDLEDTLLGASTRWGPATLTAEYENYRSSLVPYTSYLASLDVSHRFADIHTVSANALYRRVLFEDDEEARLRSVVASYSLAPTHWPSITLSAGRERSVDRGLNDKASFAGVELNWRIRSTRLSLEYKITKRDDDFAEELSHSFLLSLRRSF